MSSSQLLALQSKSAPVLASNHLLLLGHLWPMGLQEGHTTFLFGKNKGDG